MNSHGGDLRLRTGRVERLLWTSSHSHDDRLSMSLVGVRLFQKYARLLGNTARMVTVSPTRTGTRTAWLALSEAAVWHEREKYENPCVTRPRVSPLTVTVKSGRRLSDPATTTYVYSLLPGR
jgi:hypothetical protein